MREVLVEKIVPKKSSLIEFLIYNKQDNILQVSYKRGKHSGKVITYRDFPADSFDMIITSESQGRTLLRELKRYKKEKDSFFKFFINLFTKNNKIPY
ncbi:KTSC domain-containing protein [Flammeovirga yaeyamensis]|uniref:KTSC domain-containing protein n=1 Tax=Flammeovirga yaeyamensis TaxID=367791 RepID=A0AAX1N1Y2_9BACT|nr:MULTISPECIES: KTSC domain-containing protein [Flammeovirga]ANQ51314.1 KTSC domain-containing protein [Flammeovirga sp. MY04]MBB3698369.1 putative CopG family antitoxin [Flammeovirga yaeyamensis]NMF34279.1 KTSC domain-containing protein [Flammeovirga yaeyamensis]QWG01262.1 KTSC domain-containing protein [Flammeovirga yaeyamensis]